jgi:hypothetical protein
MNLTGEMLCLYVPDFVRRRALRELFQATATAFGTSVPAPSDESADQLLERYAAFTAAQATVALASGKDVAPIRRKLFESAYAMGVRLRRELGVNSTTDAMAAARAVYRMLRIDFRTPAEGEVRIPQCYFSRFYSPAVCELISALDQGLLAGLSGGGRLAFRQRITEGAACCVANFAEASS